MRELERKPGQAVRIGAYSLRVLKVEGGEVLLALNDPDQDCAGCGRQLEWLGCPACQSVTAVCPDCQPSWQCPRCSS